MWFESEDAVVPKGKSCRTVPNSKQITWHRFDDNALEEAGDKAPPTEEEVCVYMEAITDETKSKNERKEIGKFVGWTHVGLLYHFVIMYHFCLIKDVPPDLMHLSMVLIKDLLRITVTILSGWKGQPEDNPCGINEWDFGFWLHMLASFFRRNMHPGFST